MLQKAALIVRSKCTFRVDTHSRPPGRLCSEMHGPDALSFASGGRQVGVEHFPAPVSGPQPAVLLLHGGDGLQAGRHYHLAAPVVAPAGYQALLFHYLDRNRGSPAPPSHNWPDISTFAG